MSSAERRLYLSMMRQRRSELLGSRTRAAARAGNERRRLALEQVREAAALVAEVSTAAGASAAAAADALPEAPRVRTLEARALARSRTVTPRHAETVVLRAPPRAPRSSSCRTARPPPWRLRGRPLR
jgi:hypothetical protein